MLEGRTSAYTTPQVAMLAPLLFGTRLRAEAQEKALSGEHTETCSCCGGGQGEDARWSAEEAPAQADRPQTARLGLETCLSLGLRAVHQQLRTQARTCQENAMRSSKVALVG